jgi:uncharacterized membrane protein YkoI
MPKILAALPCAIYGGLWSVIASAAMSDKEKAELAPAASSSKVTLEQGLAASKTNGKPVSAKFEIENGKPQLLIYTIKDGSKYFEVIVDRNSGEIVKAEPITDGDRLVEAKKQSDGLFRATRELREAVKEAKQNNPGYNAVDVWSEMKDDHSVTTVTLVKDNDWKTAVVDLTVYKPLIKE